MKKIFFAIYDMGAGHRSTANSLKAVIESCALPWEVTVVEVLKDVLGTTFAQDFYNSFTLKRKWAKLINDPISVPIFKSRIRLMHASWLKQLRRYWQAQQPDMVVSLMPLLNQVLYESLQAELPTVPFVTSVTDFADCPKRFWLEPAAQMPNQTVICPSAQVASQARTMGYSDKALFQTSGVVIHPRYSQCASTKEGQHSQKYQRRSLGLQPDLPTGLVCFGSHGSREMLEIAQRLSQHQEEQNRAAFQLIFVCGRNQVIAEQLRQYSTAYPKYVEGFTNQLPTYMSASDFFIGKPGSVGVSEAIALGLPVITECNHRMTLFQERASADWLESNGFGLVVSSFSQIDKAVEKLLETETFEQYQSRVSAYSNRAAFEVIDILEKILNPALLGKVPQPLVM